MSSTLVILLIAAAFGMTAFVFYKTVLTGEWRNKAPRESESWYFWVFYFNPRDRRVFLPKRTGLGWTINLANPLGLFLLLLAIFLLLAKLVTMAV